MSHDAIDPQFYIFHNNYKKFTILTDTGYVSDRMKGMIRGSDAFIFESNHDVDMLRMCRYPWKTKQRILGDMGHVSNEDAGHAMTDVITGNTKRIYLSHLSQDNNMKDLARMSVGQVLNEHDIDTEKKYCYVIRIKLFQRQYIQYRESPIKFRTAVKRLYRVLFISLVENGCC